MLTSNIKPARKTRYISLKTKVTMTIAGIILLFGSLATITVFTLTRKTLAQTKRDDLTTAAVNQSLELYQVLNASKKLVKTVAIQPAIIDFLNDPSADKMEPTLEHLNLYNIDNQYSSIYLMDRDGLTLVSTNQSFVGKNYGFRSYFKEATANGSFVDISIGVTSKQLGYYFSHSIRDDKDRVVGVIVAKMTPDVVNELVVKNSKEDQKTLLVDSHGVVISSSTPSREYHSLGVLTSEILQEIKLRRRFDGIDIQPLDYQLAQDYLPHYIEPVSFDLYDERDKADEIITIVQITDLPFFLVTETEYKDLVSPVLRIASLLGLFVALAAIFATIIISILLSRFLSPLSKLQQASEQLSRGNFDQKLDVSTHDELQELANTFNRMTDSLKESRANIEQKVKDRTAELEKTVNLMTGRELKMIELKKEIKYLKTKK